MTYQSTSYGEFALKYKDYSTLLELEFFSKPSPCKYSGNTIHLNTV